MKGNDYYNIHKKFQVHSTNIFGLGAKINILKWHEVPDLLKLMMWSLVSVWLRHWRYSWLHQKIYNKLHRNYAISCFQFVALFQIMGFFWFVTTPTGLAMVLSIVWLWIFFFFFGSVPFIKYWLFERRCSLFLPKQIIPDLVSSWSCTTVLLLLKSYHPSTNRLLCCWVWLRLSFRWFFFSHSSYYAKVIIMIINL